MPDNITPPECVNCGKSGHRVLCACPHCGFIDPTQTPANPLPVTGGLLPEPVPPLFYDDINGELLDSDGRLLAYMPTGDNGPETAKRDATWFIVHTTPAPEPKEGETPSDGPRYSDAAIRIAGKIREYLIRYGLMAFKETEAGMADIIDTEAAELIDEMNRAISGRQEAQESLTAMRVKLEEAEALAKDLRGVNEGAMLALNASDGALMDLRSKLAASEAQCAAKDKAINMALEQANNCDYSGVIATLYNESLTPTQQQEGAK